MPCPGYCEASRGGRYKGASKSHLADMDRDQALPRVTGASARETGACTSSNGNLSLEVPDTCRSQVSYKLNNSPLLGSPASVPVMNPGTTATPIGDTISTIIPLARQIKQSKGAARGRVSGVSHPLATRLASIKDPRIFRMVGGDFQAGKWCEAHET